MAKKSTQRDINATQRAQMALQLRKSGQTLDEIARQCGYQDRSGAYRAIKRELDRIPVDAVQDLRKVEMLRLDELYAVCHKRMMDKETKDPLWAIDRMLKISEQRAKLLGLDTQPDAAMNQNIVVVREIPGGYLGVSEAKTE